MIKWLRKNWPWAAFNLTALTIMSVLLVRGLSEDPTYLVTLAPLFEYSGKWAIRFLLLCLSMTPLHTLFGWRTGLKLRKSAGLWAFAFAAVHFLRYTGFRPTDLRWLRDNSQIYILMGLTTLSILSLLALTSNRWAMRWLGKGWKRLHRLVYLAGTLAGVHAILAFTNGKRYFMEGEPSAREFYIYLIVVVVLLALRLPFVKAAVAHLKRRRAAPAVTKTPVPALEWLAPASLPDPADEPDLLPDEHDEPERVLAEP
ncbi:MAG: ferric reductase-like transmembrane domain-containing protein [Anaerolineae bacterium]|nr:ferric reductase-like transmembrane domain-containing protein [Anaerolineae bacterium]